LVCGGQSPPARVFGPLSMPSFLPYLRSIFAFHIWYFSQSMFSFL
jgi:hypothetical protein